MRSADQVGDRHLELVELLSKTPAGDMLKILCISAALRELEWVLDERQRAPKAFGNVSLK